MNDSLEPNDATIERTFPDLSIEAAEEADASLTHYALLVHRIYTRLRKDRDAYAALKRKLTDQLSDDSIEGSQPT